MREITICYPSKKIGGAQLLFARVAKELIKREYKIVIIDYKDGFINSYLSNQSFTFIEYSDKIILQNKTTFLVALDFWIKLRNRFDLNNETKFIFWDLHPLNLIATFNFSRIYLPLPTNVIRILITIIEPFRRKKIRKFLCCGIVNGGIKFMSIRNYYENKFFFNLKFNDREIDFLPISIPESKTRNVKKVKSDMLNIAFISRFDKEKTRTFISFIRELEHNLKRNEAISKKICLHIIGEGEKEVLLRNILKSSSLEYRFLGRLSGENLDEYLIENINLGIGMGTTAIEFSKIRIPFILLPGAVKENLFQKSNLKYMFFHESAGYQVSVSRFSEKNSKIYNIKDLIRLFSEVDCNEKFDKIGQDGYKFYLKEYSFNSIINKLIDIDRNCTFTYKDIIKSSVLSLSVLEFILLFIKRFVKN